MGIVSVSAGGGDSGGGDAGIVSVPAGGEKVTMESATQGVHSCTRRLCACTRQARKSPPSSPNPQ